MDVVGAADPVGFALLQPMLRRKTPTFSLQDGQGRRLRAGRQGAQEQVIRPPRWPAPPLVIDDVHRGSVTTSKRRSSRRQPRRLMSVGAISSERVCASSRDMRESSGT